MRGTAILATALLLPILAGTARSQEPVPAPPAPAAEPAAPKPKPRPKPKPKPAPKAEAPPESRAEPAAKEPEKDAGPGLPTQPLPDPGSAPKPEPPATETPPPSPSQGAFAAPPVACEPGKSVLYDGPKDVSIWVTRTGKVTIDNPLRPLTPDVTRVLQIVIGGRPATAYGRELDGLRRGGPPGALEGLLGGPIHWDAALASLPDKLDIVSDSGAPLAELHFKECGDAPAVKAAPVAKAKKDGSKQTRKGPAADQAGASAAPTPANGSPTAGAAPPRRFNLPQGAIPE